MKKSVFCFLMLLAGVAFAEADLPDEKNDFWYTTAYANREMVATRTGAAAQLSFDTSICDTVMSAVQSAFDTLGSGFLLMAR